VTRPIPEETGERVPAGTLEEITRARAKVVPLARRDGRPRSAIVVLDDAGVPRGYLNECRHVPIPLDGGSGYVLDHSKRFLLCGTHGALYEKRTGLCVTGPCRGASLVRMELEVGDDGVVVVVDR
jgi:nitrite reductase/ring-hydroxylating ferredoxin subunit